MDEECRICLAPHNIKFSQLAGFTVDVAIFCVDALEHNAVLESFEFCDVDEELPVNAVM